MNHRNVLSFQTLVYRLAVVLLWYRDMRVLRVVRLESTGVYCQGCPFWCLADQMAVIRGIKRMRPRFASMSTP